MALAFWVDHPDAIGMLFAAHDEYLGKLHYLALFCVLRISINCYGDWCTIHHVVIIFDMNSPIQLDIFSLIVSVLYLVIKFIQNYHFILTVRFSFTVVPFST